MRALNLYMLSQIRDHDVFSKYENNLSDRMEAKEARENEQECIEALVGILDDGSMSLESFDGFYYSFVIDHIGKEFDLLKLSADTHHILNIELKWIPVESERIRKQLIQNRYYLGHISKDVDSYTYVRSVNKFYTLGPEDCLIETNAGEVRRVMSTFSDYYEKDIEKLFLARDFLISPANDPQRFLDGGYFLTQQQSKFREEILALKKKPPRLPLFIGIKGSPGTGKTLLVYDLATTLSRNPSAELEAEYAEGIQSRNTPVSRVLIIHCGRLSPGHQYLDDHVKNMHISSVHDLMSMSEEEIASYDTIFVDEVEQMNRAAFMFVVGIAKRHNLFCIFSYDSDWLSHAERKKDSLAHELRRFVTRTFELSRRIRVNREISSFLRMLVESKLTNDNFRYENVDVIYSNNPKITYSFIDYYQKKGYVYISLNKKADMELINSDENHETVYSLNEAVGQEFDDVLLVLDHSFYYDSKGSFQIHSRDPHFERLFYQTVVRAREHLCLVVEKNFKLFRHINNLLAEKRM